MQSRSEGNVEKETKSSTQIVPGRYPDAVLPSFTAYLTTGTIRTAFVAVPYWKDMEYVISWIASFVNGVQLEPFFQGRQTKFSFRICSS